MIIDYDIQNIELSDKFLTDPVLLALAWKRAHNYVRSLNWYADNFELDKSSLFLPFKIEDWICELRSKNIKLSQLELVPAPKASHWVFSEAENLKDNLSQKCLVWKPKDEDKLSLRPLAHIGIKEQTYFTLLMSCLANTLETKQGNPATNFQEVHAKGVVNYGNRLYCTYNDDKAEHNYGSSTIYSKYFVDYRNFLKRPEYFAAQQYSEKLSNEEVYIVELDLKQFFDHVNRRKLVEKVKELQGEQQIADYDRNSHSQTVSALLDKFINWEWSKEAHEDYAFCLAESDTKKEIKVPKGIPQGLVAGGFLANIYLLEIDELMVSLLNVGQSKDVAVKEEILNEIKTYLKVLNKYCIKINDYCRYVDDIRLVISAPKLSKEFTLELLTRQISKLASVFLTSRKLNLIINKEKTKVIPYRHKYKGISIQTDIIQQRVSGPLSPEHVDNLINELESLLDLSSTENIIQDGNSSCINKLAEIERSTLDVREDTLRRFTTNKLCKALKEKRHFTSREVDQHGRPLPGEWDFSQERIARKLIAVWSKDPALVLLLKKGLELFPSPRVLEPVLDQLEKVKEVSNQQKAIANYCLAEIFRHSATVIHKKDLHAIPAQADISGFFEILQQRAAKLLSSSNNIQKKWNFLTDQARFLLLVRLDTVLEESAGDEKCDLIFKLAKGFRNIELKEAEKQDVALYILLANQLLDDNHSLLRSSVELISKQFEENGDIDFVENVLASIAVQDIELVGEIIKQARLLKALWLRFDKIKNIIKKVYLDDLPSQKPLEEIKTKQSIVQLIIRKDNPFANEIMAIKLMQGLITEVKNQAYDLKNKQINLAATKVHSTFGFSEIPRYADFEEELKVEIEFQEPLISGFLDNSMSQQSLTMDEVALRKIAFVIRAALSSSKDITGFGMNHKPKAGYRGLKSTRTKREIGLYTTPESLAGEGAQTSGWLTTLISKLLRWPGIRINDQGYTWPQSFTINEVEKLLSNRLEELRRFYCQLSLMPALPELISPKWDESKVSLNVVMVQSKLPRQSDFGSDLYLNNHQYRTKHRRHIASVAALTVEYIKVGNFQADLIVWPELAVHEEDLDVLKQLSQKTHAIIFAGLGFLKNANNRATNTAVWIVPRKHNGNSNEIMRLQGKYHLTKLERGHVDSWRPYQLILELRHPKYPNNKGFMLTGAICYDATDIKLSADLTNKSNAFVISALNQDVNTFDVMVEALHYHMFQHVVLVNTGEYGGSYAMAPYKERHEKLIAHNSGKDQVAISSFQLNMFDFRRDGIGKGMMSGLKIKTEPAGVDIS